MKIKTHRKRRRKARIRKYDQNTKTTVKKRLFFKVMFNFFIFIYTHVCACHDKLSTNIVNEFLRKIQFLATVVVGRRSHVYMHILLLVIF